MLWVEPRIYVVQQFVDQRIQPGLFTLARIDFDQAVGMVLPVAVSRLAFSVTLPPQFSLGERRGIESL